MAGLLYQQLQQSGTVGSGTGHLHLVSLKHDSDAVQDDRMVVGNDDARLHGNSWEIERRTKVACDDSAKRGREEV
jgi:hypothetical protein